MGGSSLSRAARIATGRCRGSGEDGDGPDLFRLGIGNARISAVIRKGIPDEMPSFAKSIPHKTSPISQPISAHSMTPDDLHSGQQKSRAARSAVGLRVWLGLRQAALPVTGAP